MASAEDHSGSYNWNIRARLIQVLSAGESEDDPTFDEADIIIHYAHPDDLLTESGPIEQFIIDNQLNHGDLVRFGTHRFESSFIVMRNPGSGEFSWILNPDESAAGYVTIPAEVLCPVTDALAKYSHFINDDGVVPSINLHLSPRDRFIKEKLGEDVSDDYQFDIHYIWQRLEEFYISFQGGASKPFNPDTMTLQDVLGAFADEKQGQSRLFVRVYLAEESFVQYKQTYGQNENKYAWLQKLPRLPQAWTVEKGQSRMGPNNCAWVWKLDGPKAGENQMRANLGQFLQDFEFEYGDNGDLPKK